MYIADITLKLVGGGSYYGRVELTHDNHTGTICDSAWSTSDARVVCKYLGFADGDPVTGSYYGKGSGHVMMNGLGCYGYENNIVQCRNKGWMSYNGTDCAKHDNDASVVCYKDGELSYFVKFYMSPGVRKPPIWILTRSDTNQAVQPLKMARGLKIRI